MSRFPLVPLGEFLTLALDEVVVRPDETYRTAGIYSFGRGLFSRPPFLGAETKYRKLFRLREGQFVYSRLFAWEGALAVVDPQFDGQLVSQEFPTFDIDANRAGPDFVAWLCRWRALWESMASGTKGLGLRRQRVHPEQVMTVKVPLPESAVQRSIALWLDSLAAYVAAMGSLAEAAFAKSEVLYPALTESLLEANARERVPLAQLVDFISDVVRPKDDRGAASVFIGLQHVRSNTGERVGEVTLGDETGRKFRFAPGDILYGYLRPYLNKVWVADRAGLCSVDQYVLRPTGALSAGLIAHAMRSRGFLREAIELTHNLQLPRLRSGLLSGLEIPVPPKDRRVEIESRLEALRQRAIQLRTYWRERVERSEALMPSLLSAALNGTSRPPTSAPARSRPAARASGGA